MVRTCAIFALVCTLAGCATPQPPPSKLESPAKALMIAPEALSEIKQGDDLVSSHARLRASYGRETGKLRRLQVWVRTVLDK